MKPPPGLLALIACRMEAIAIGHLALRHSMLSEEVPDIRIDFNGKQD